MSVRIAITFLVSPEARWITGAILPIDGGYTAGRTDHPKMGMAMNSEKKTLVV